MKQRRLVVVLGMHRSGTSALTRGLRVLGVELGDRMMPASAMENPTGYWEDLDLNALNIEMLRVLGTDWSHVAGLAPRAVESLRTQGYFLRAAELLRKKAGDAAVFGFKDPRVAVLLPFWKEVFAHCGFQVSYILPVRHPLSVVKSLAKRGGIEATQGYLLWMAHVLGSLAGSADTRRVVVDYDRLMQAPGRELSRIAQRFALAINPAELQHYQSEFLDPALRHTVYAPEDLLHDDSCPSVVREMYAALLGVASDALDLDDPGLKARIAHWEEEHARTRAALVLIDQLNERSAVANLARVELEQQVALRDGQVAALNQAVRERDAQVAQLTDETVKRGEWGLRLDAELRARDEHIAGLNRSIGERDAHLGALRQSLAQQEVLVADLQRDIAQGQARLSELQRDVTARDGRIVALDQDIAARDDQLARLGADATLHEQAARQLESALDGQTRRTAELEQVLGVREARLAALQQEADAQREQIRFLEAELQLSRERFQRLVASNSWRITRPLREARRWITAPVLQAKRYARAGLRLARGLYQALPLSVQTRQRHQGWLAAHAPRLLAASGATVPAVPAAAVTPVAAPASAIVHPVPAVPVIQVAAPVRVDALPTSEAPRVSVIIPVYGKIDYTLRCLASIAAHPPQVPFEVIVVDDCSPDDSAQVLEQVRGVRVVRNQVNQGFIRSCNAGAAAARGDYLHFLNNDTEVKPGWLDELLRTYHAFPGTGLAGSKLLYPDGRLQEAGGIIWQDGSAWNFGRLQDPELPVFNYAREVDYCSGASIMVPKRLFDELGGFDGHYLPAYCEDSDLALKIRDKGYRVIYQPLSVVVHHEGVTSGTDLAHGAKAYQVENTRKLYERWKGRLSRHQAPGVDVDNAKDRMAVRRVLVIDHCTPTPNQDAGSVTAINLLLLLREMGFQVTFIPEDNFYNMPVYTAELQRAGIEALYSPYVTTVQQHLVEQGGRYDLVFLFRPKVAERHLGLVREFCSKAKVLYETADLHFLRMMREAELQADAAKRSLAEKMKVRELGILQGCDASIIRSTAELEMLQEILPQAKLHLFPLIMNVGGTDRGFSLRRDIVFVGGYQHTPNVDAVVFFVNEVMPALRKRLSGIRFHIVGSHPPAEVLALQAEDVEVVGFVEDLSSLLNQMRVSVAPLRYGAGIKGKVGTAMAAGLPVVATSLAAEGMSLQAGEDILVADDADAFADAIARLYRDERLWMRLSERGVRFAEHAWGAEAAWRTMAGIISDLGLNPVRGMYPLSLYSDGEQLPVDFTPPLLRPLASVRTRAEYEVATRGEEIQRLKAHSRQLAEQAGAESFTVEGYCIPCERRVDFIVDMQWGGRRHADGWTPNWRERMECPHCRMNNRQRLVAGLVKQRLAGTSGQRVYFMEQVTPIFQWAKATFPDHHLVGSEYLGHQYRGGDIVEGIRHEDVENLSFADGSLDLIVSNDVFEHVPNPPKAFRECSRVLRVGGEMLATIPFHAEQDVSVVRSKIVNGAFCDLLPQVFHGIPVSVNGALVFTDFGWDMVETMRNPGFGDVKADLYGGISQGHLGQCQIVFAATK